ncbi:MAG TPA: hypothetical protein VNA44_08340, partial [Burkholderiaceae bacterium]|nr:hypothetical protein [Burkholderiaceae bacterium]
NLHQVEYAREFAQRVVGVSAGRVVFVGSPAELTDDVLQKIYPARDAGTDDAPKPAPHTGPQLKGWAMEDA